MSGIDYLADTNAILYLLSGKECMGPFLRSHLFVSVISFMELLYAIICATAIENGLPLITADTGFDRADELKLIHIVP